MKCLSLTPCSNSYYECSIDAILFSISVKCRTQFWNVCIVNFRCACLFVLKFLETNFFVWFRSEDGMIKIEKYICESRNFVYQIFHHIILKFSNMFVIKCWMWVIYSTKNWICCVVCIVLIFVRIFFTLDFWNCFLFVSQIVWNCFLFIFH